MRHIKRRRGDTKAEEFQVLSKTTGLPYDITGATFLMTADPSPSPTDATANIFQLTGAITNAPQGVVEFPLTVGDANQLGTFYYDVQMTHPGGGIETVDKGVITFKQDITK